LEEAVNSYSLPDEMTVLERNKSKMPSPFSELKRP